MANTFYEKPILNSPYASPSSTDPLDEHGQPLGLRQSKAAGHRNSSVPVPKAKRRRRVHQETLDLETYDDMR